MWQDHYCVFQLVQPQEMMRRSSPFSSLNLVQMNLGISKLMSNCHIASLMVYV